MPTKLARLPVRALQRIALAKTKSDAISKQDGTFRERPKVERQVKSKAAAGAVRAVPGWSCLEMVAAPCLLSG